MTVVPFQVFPAGGQTRERAVIKAPHGIAPGPVVDCYCAPVPMSASLFWHAGENR